MESSLDTWGELISKANLHPVHSTHAHPFYMGCLHGEKT